MPCFTSLLTAADGPASAGSPASDIASAVLGYGIVGIIAVVMAWLFWKGWRLIPPAKEAEIRATVRSEARADLEPEIARLVARAEKAEAQRDDALQIIQNQWIPLLLNFTNATSALLPILQDLIRHREAGRSDAGRRQR